MRYKIEVNRLGVACQKKAILEGITLKIPENKITALVGPSGCGKSTFLKALNRMNEEEFPVVTEGAVFLDGEDIYHPRVNKTRLRKKVGMIFQQPNPFPMSIFDNVAYGPRAHGIRKREKLEEIVEKSLRQAAIWEEIGGNPYQKTDRLSGGQKQRLCIARALAVEPEVLLMDEPTSALDPKAAEKVEELMDSLKESRTIVLVTHNLRQARQIADETALFMEGKLIEIGQTDQIFLHPKKPETKKYLKVLI